MTDEEDIFQTAASLPPDKRAEYLDAICEERPEMRRRLEALLHSHEEAAGFMEAKTDAHRMARVAGLEATDTAAEASGDRIGRYRLLQQIGEGGFGVVWMADQEEPVRRRVALKIVKAGMDTREVIARFEAERQALAMMDHPNIAKVFDAGETARGRPYFVMELVHGLPITKFCDERTLTTRQRLELFSEVCSAVAHAHQKGIIHRDLKPSNIMVALDGDQPVPKIIDFGIAKATQGRLTNHTLFTRFEQFVGTPAYMSPEQTAISGLDIDTRSDIYALGVLLYELLTGETPFDTRSLLSAGYDEMRRIICEVEPPKPSTRLNTLAGEERTTLARTRQVAPEKLDRLVEQDLDWIVMKALEKDRARRYETVNSLALDVQRFLSGEPVSAMPPSPAYRFRKFARRHRAMLRTAAAIAAVLVAATVVSALMAVRAIRAEQVTLQKAADEATARLAAEEARRATDDVSRFLSDIITKARPEDGDPSITVVESIQRSLAGLNDVLSDHPDQRFELVRNVSWSLHTLGFTRQIIPIVEQARNSRIAAFGRDDPKWLNLSLSLANYYISVDRLEDALPIFEELSGAELNRSPERVRERLQAMAGVAHCYSELGRHEEARALQQQAMNGFRALSAPGQSDHLVARMLAALASSWHEEGEHAKALELREEALSIWRTEFRPENPGLMCSALLASAQSRARLGQAPQALALREEAESLRRAELRGLQPADRASPYVRTRLEMEAALAGGRIAEAVRLGRDLAGLHGQRPLSERPAPEARLASALLLRAAAEPDSTDAGGAAAWRSEADQLVHGLAATRVDLEEGLARVDLFLRHCQWLPAARLCGALHEVYPGHSRVLVRLAPLLIETAQETAYHTLCDKLLHPFVSSPPDNVESLMSSLLAKDAGVSAEALALLFCLHQHSGDRLRWAAQLADAVATLPDDVSQHRLTRGVAAFRNGDDAAAIPLLEAAIPRLNAVRRAAAEAVRAMAYARRGERETARTALAEASWLLNDALVTGPRIALHREPWEWLGARVLLKEAEAMLGDAR